MRLLFYLALTLCSIPIHASGWNDYELPIDPDYTIFRTNSLDVCLGEPSGSLIYVPDNYPDTGPITGYEVSASHIFLHTVGRKPRNLFQGDTFEEIDFSQDFYFILDKATQQFTGPLTLTQFNTHAAVTQHGSVHWTAPRNPNIAVPLLGAAMFLLITAMIFGGPILIIAIPILISIMVAKRKKTPRPTH